MLLESVDQEPNLYRVSDVMSSDLVSKIMAMPWLDLPWQPLEGQSQRGRRCVSESCLPWSLEWDLACHALCAKISAAIGYDMGDYVRTAWYLDEPGYVCQLHPNDEMPGNMHLCWIGARIDLGTTFYWYNDLASKRCQFAMATNAGYVAISRPNHNGTKNLLWNGMLEPVPRNTFRLSSHSWFDIV